MPSKIDPQTLDQAFAQVNEEVLKMFLKKHKDYGKGNILSIEELGVSMRILEKAERLKNLLIKQGQNPVNESIEETWIDIATYAIIGVLFRRGQFQKLDVDKNAMISV
ncbi:DUF1599 domain-containing protein [Patescibacteria group bacterium]|nr:DUF1599 domain-containing protein [Patescibacteria group bacterium]MBU1885756.1 DUF1599 domain-containing protein [Patescibacteria group bacterium]